MPELNTNIMGWTDTFPVLDESHVIDYLAEASKSEMEELDSFFRIVENINKKPHAQHIVATSLFWKGRTLSDPERKQVVTRETMMRGVTLDPTRSDRRQSNPWQYYVDPILTGAQWLSENRPDVALRIYLANDLQFLIPDLLKHNVEICLMEHSSIRAAPGTLWRFLAYAEAGQKLVTVTDADRMMEIASDIARTEILRQSNLGGWRVPVFGILNDRNELCYRPMLAGQNGVSTYMDAGQLAKATLWSIRHCRIRTETMAPGVGRRRLFGTEWPNYGFDEFFLLVAIYPRLAREGILTFVSTLARTPYLAMDIEFAMWSNNRSELIWWEDPTAAIFPLAQETDVALTVSGNQKNLCEGENCCC